MRIKFVYTNGDIKERNGLLLSVSQLRDATYFLVREDGADHPKSFLYHKMSEIQTYPERGPIEVAATTLAEKLGEAADAALALVELAREARK